MVTNLLLLAHQLATSAMFGIIWFVQIVHYPLFANVGSAAFTDYEALHQRRTTWVVMPLMLIEAATALLLLISGWSELDRMILGANVGLLALVWLSTFFWQVPLHARLARSFNIAAQRQLVRSNWLRTLLWSVRLVLLAVLLFGKMA